jgi:hypothetical protein
VDVCVAVTAASGTPNPLASCTVPAICEVETACPHTKAAKKETQETQQPSAISVDRIRAHSFIECPISTADISGHSQ